MDNRIYYIGLLVGVVVLVGVPNPVGASSGRYFPTLHLRISDCQVNLHQSPVLLPEASMTSWQC